MTAFRVLVGAGSLVVVASLLGLGAWAGLPRLQEISGIGGSPLDRAVTVRFAADAKAADAWGFRPVQDEMKLRLGETGIAFYEASNPSDHAVTGQGSYRVSPAAFDKYVVRLACFCTQSQELQPHEKIDMPVTFYIDPAIAKDAAARGLREITLSYTYTEAELPAAQTTPSPAAKSPVN